MNLSLVVLAPAIGIGLLCGGVVGLLHFAGLRYTVRLLATGRTGLALASQGLRVLLSALLLAALFHFGLAALLTGFVGFLAARQALLRDHAAAAMPPAAGEPHP